MSPTRPAIPRLIPRPRRTATLTGVATYHGAHATGYRTLVPRAASTRTREAIRTDVVRLARGSSR